MTLSRRSAHRTPPLKETAGAEVTTGQARTLRSSTWPRELWVNYSCCVARESKTERAREREKEGTCVCTWVHVCGLGAQRPAWSLQRAAVTGGLCARCHATAGRRSCSTVCGLLEGGSDPASLASDRSGTSTGHENMSALREREGEARKTFKDGHKCTLLLEISACWTMWRAEI